MAKKKPANKSTPAVSDTSGGNLADFKNALLNAPKIAAKGIQDWSQSQARTFTNPYINAAGKVVGKNLNLPVSGKKEAVSNTIFGVVDIASGPIGRVAAKAAKSAAGAVGARAASKVYYGIHGSPTSGLSKIAPQIGTNTQGFNKNVTKMFGSNSAVTSPKVFSYKPEPTNVAATTQYAQDAGRGTGSVYVVKTKAKNVLSNIVDTSKAASFTDSFAAQSLTREQMSSKAMKVVKEFPVSNYTKKTYNAMEGGWETTQDFGPLSQQIKDAIQSNKKFKFANLAKLPKKK